MEKIEETGLSTFMLVIFENLYQESVTQFYLNFKYDEAKETINYKINSEKLNINKKTLTKYFGLKDDGEDVLHY